MRNELNIHFDRISRNYLGSDKNSKKRIRDNEQVSVNRSKNS